MCDFYSANVLLKDKIKFPQHCLVDNCDLFLEAKNFVQRMLYMNGSFSLEQGPKRFSYENGMEMFSIGKRYGNVFHTKMVCKLFSFGNGAIPAWKPFRIKMLQCK